MNGRAQNLRDQFPWPATPLRLADPPRTRGRRPSPQRGMVLVVVLVSFVVVLATLTALVRLAMSHRQAVESEGRRLESRWLARSGAARAVARLAADAQYAGETWNIPAAELGVSDAARVEIRVEAVAGRPQRRSVRVQADFPAESVERARSTWQRDVELPPAASKPAEKPVEKPATKPIEKPVEKPAAKPAAKPVEKPVEKTSSKR